MTTHLGSSHPYDVNTKFNRLNTHICYIQKYKIMNTIVIVNKKLFQDGQKLNF